MQDASVVGGLTKRSFDICFALCALFSLCVLLAVIALFIFALDGRPVFIRHERVGRKGRRFGCLKFRTMVVNGDEMLERVLRNDPGCAAQWRERRKLTNDPRVTRVGAFLRKSSLDELPQLFNIIAGQMSVVGPRPIVEAEIPNYDNNMLYYVKARPGLTGLWQISGRSDTTYALRVSLDRSYVETWSFTNDIVIIAKTIPAVLRSQGVY